jgi:glutamate racemase
MSAPPIIGVFDSGVGGLTVLRALLSRLPGASFVYAGDTARLPYGSKSRATIARYATDSARFLVDQGAEFLVIACNTASALALDEIREAVSVPVLGVVDPGAAEAAAHSRTRDCIVLATSATVESRAYANACAHVGVRAFEKACPLLVPLVEESWTNHAVTREVTKIYLDEAMAGAALAGLDPDSIVLGCTHYPLLRPLFAELVPSTIRIVDSAESIASRVAADFPAAAAENNASECSFFATDSVNKFRALGERFLGRTIPSVQLVDLGG